MIFGKVFVTQTQTLYASLLCSDLRMTQGGRTIVGSNCNNWLS